MNSIMFNEIILLNSIRTSTSERGGPSKSRKYYTSEKNVQPIFYLARHVNQVFYKVYPFNRCSVSINFTDGSFYVQMEALETQVQIEPDFYVRIRRRL